MFEKRILLSSIFLIITVTTRYSFACRVPDDYVQPSNYQLTKLADAILFARVTDFVEPQDDSVGIVRFTVEKVLKGEFTDKSFEDEGYDHFLGASNSQDFSKARAGAYVGTCIAKDYRKSHLYLLFLKMKGGKWQVLDLPFTRVNEEVINESDPWGQAINHYIRISELQNSEKEKLALAELRSSVAETELNQAMIADIDRHFALSSSRKPH